MSHLGGRVSALVDGRLSVDATERALVHLATCAGCRREVAAEREVRRMLAAGEPTAPDDLTSSLLALGGQHGPLSPRHPLLPPGAPEPGSPPPPAPGVAGWDGGGWPQQQAPWRSGGAPSDGGPRHAVRLPTGPRARVAAGGSLAVLATGALGIGLLGAPVPASSTAPAAGTAAVTAATPAAATGTAAVETGRDTQQADAAAAGGLWEHVVRGTRVLCVLVTGS